MLTPSNFLTINPDVGVPEIDYDLNDTEYFADLNFLSPQQYHPHLEKMKTQFYPFLILTVLSLKLSKYSSRHICQNVFQQFLSTGCAQGQR
jgi:hypothetical protein